MCDWLRIRLIEKNNAAPVHFIHIPVERLPQMKLKIKNGESLIDLKCIFHLLLFLHSTFALSLAPFQSVLHLFNSFFFFRWLTKNECVFYSFQRFRSIQCYDTRAFYVLFQLFPRATLNVQFYIASICICICVHVCTHTTIPRAHVPLHYIESSHSQ